MGTGHSAGTCTIRENVTTENDQQEYLLAIHDKHTCLRNNAVTLTEPQRQLVFTSQVH